MLDKKTYIGPEVDVWSLGVLIYCLTTGFFPWEGKTIAEQTKNAINAKYEFPPFLSYACRHVIERCLVVDAKKRATIAELRENAWINQNYREALTATIPSFNPNAYSDIDIDTLNDLEKIGVRKEEVVEDLLSEHKYRYTYAIYSILVYHKRKQLQQKLTSSRHLGANRSSSREFVRSSREFSRPPRELVRANSARYLTNNRSSSRELVHVAPAPSMIEHTAITKQRRGSKSVIKRIIKSITGSKRNST